MTSRSARAGLDFLHRLNQLHRDSRGGNTELDARIKALEDGVDVPFDEGFVCRSNGFDV